MDHQTLALLPLARRRQEVSALLTCNEKTASYGLTLSGEEVLELVECRDRSLRERKRVEFGEGILNLLIETFCDSPYLNGENYLDTLKRLQDIFYEYKNDSADLLTDDELLTFLREQFDSVCGGDMDYLEQTCAERFARAIRKGYRGYQQTGGRKEYSKWDEETRWDGELYWEALKNLF
ncbi:DUF6323 family protein [Cuneatibacter sp. NSJ-177]|uniref:DUF6323 family protein n=1 Tax=Cuneatibacter sp. NSJ-177 TaxID=2931401 RepID=UPI001FD20A82|nr:DUF6323 family protein [Cuneatibacter sp. NSJ-177]MCJ7837382.1 DUF6323 family protein [Cuneatibacter sp. NSJ-177]